MIHIGIDPGVKNGFAVWDTEKQQFDSITTICFWEAIETVFSYIKYKGHKNVAVFIEDSAGNKPIFQKLKTSNELDTSSDNQLAENLEKITSYITTISSSEFQLKNKLKKLKRELLVFTGVSNKYNSNSEWTAKQNLLSNVNTKTEYLQRLEDIDNTETLIEELIDLKWVLKERVKILITLIENRYFIKGGKHHDRSY
jgi:hypothetical protein